MASRKPRRPNNYHTNNTPHSNNNRHSQGYPQPSDYESDYQAYLSDTHQMPDQQDQSIPSAPLRSNEDLNLSVLRRHNPAVNSIQSIAPFSVIYTFSPSTRQWEKTGVEGTLFVCQLIPGSLGEERYCVFVLNRRGLNNFGLHLTDSENVEITDEFIILKSDSDATGNNSTGAPLANNTRANGDIHIYGVWVFSEPPPSSTAETRNINAQAIRECAFLAGQSLKLARERLEATRQNGFHAAVSAAAVTSDPIDEVQASVPMGRQISLRDLFGQERAQDDAWSVKAHSGAPGHGPQAPMFEAPPIGPGLQQQDILGDLFRRSGLAYTGGPQT
ncbi:hypothetical protein BDW59DRAFT_27777 [Aspergillus cavernicola]|uniref:Decapping enzyme Dcp1 n=1 Tax=Aspergillus cavernicola TaxID=176166 RepID=A0ABR4HGB0_9EURO